MTIDHRLSPILTEYDELVSALQSQIQLVSSEHQYLKSELVKLLQENQDLQKQVGNSIKLSLEKELPDQVNPLIISEMVQNLRKQLELSLKERSQLQELYEASQNQIEILKRKCLYDSEASNNKKVLYDPAISMLESKIESLSYELKIEKDVRENEESVKLKAQTEAAKFAVLLANKNDIVEEHKIREDQLLRKLENIKQENSVLVATLECVTKSRDDLEFAIGSYEKKEKKLKDNLEEAKEKVEEAVEIAEKAVRARDESVQKESIFQSEIVRLGQYIDLVTNDSSQKLTSQIAQVHDDYNKKIRALKYELEKKNNELTLNQKQIEKLLLQCKQLEMSLENRKLSDEQVNELTEEMIDQKSQLESNYKQLEDTKRALRDVLQENENLTQEMETLLERENNLRVLVVDLQNSVQYCKCKRLKEKMKKYKLTVADLEQRVTKLLSLTEKWQNESEKLELLLENSVKKCFKIKEKYKTRNKNLLSKLKFAKTIRYDK